MIELKHSEHLELDGNVLHISCENDDDWQVWLNTDVGDFDGLCIGCGQSREEAVTGAITVLDQGLRKLRQYAAAEGPYKGPITQPCSACSAGDTAMEYHDHDYVSVENRR